jgi:hypothetical protein
VAELDGAGGKPVCSWRDVAVLTEAERRARDGLAAGKPVEASSTVTVGGETYPPEAAVDGNPRTRWSSEFSDPQWIAIDLGEVFDVSRVQLSWEGAHAKSYAIEVSGDGATWKTVFETDEGRGGVEEIKFPSAKARWIRLHGTKRANRYGYSLWEIKVFP